MFLTSVKPALKLGTMRTLSEVAAKYPMSILKCNSDMEVLISDPNRWVVHGVVVNCCCSGMDANANTEASPVLWRRSGMSACIPYLDDCWVLLLDLN